MSARTPAASAPAYRWVILAAVSITLAIVMGSLVNGLAAFVMPLEHAFGWDRASVAFINTSGFLGLAIGGVVMGNVADVMGSKRIALMGVCVAGAATLLAAHANALWQFYAIYFIAGAFGGGAVFAPLMALVGGWFRTGAGLAIGIAAAGQALGQGAVPFAASVLIETIGWSSALTVLGIVLLSVCLPLNLVMKAPPEDIAAHAVEIGTATDLSPNTVIIWLSAAVFFCCTTMSVPLMHLMPLIEGCGLSASAAGSVFFGMMMVAIAGRIAFGKVADMIGALPAYLTASAWQTTLVFGFTQIHTLAAFHIFAPIYGFGYAGVMTGVLTSVRFLTPSSRRAGAMGIVGAFAWLGHGVGGFQGGLFYELTGGYELPFGNAAMSGVMNLIVVGALFLTITRRRRLAVA